MRAVCEIRGKEKPGSGSPTNSPRTVGQLVARSEGIYEQRQEKARREREQVEARKKHIQSLDGKEGALWAKVDKLIATKQPKPYDEPVSLLVDLRDLAETKGTSFQFAERINALYGEHTRKPALLERFRKAKLPG